MKKTLIQFFSLICFIVLTSQTLPEFNNKPAFYDAKTKTLLELEKSQYNTMAKAKGLMKAEAGFFLDGPTSKVKVDKKDELVFVVKVEAGTDPTSVFDLVKFEIRNDKRVFIVSKAGMGKSSTSFEKITYSVKKIKDGYYQLIANNLSEGEYFFGANDFMYAFSVK